MLLNENLFADVRITLFKGYYEYTLFINYLNISMPIE